MQIYLRYLYEKAVNKSCQCLFNTGLNRTEKVSIPSLFCFPDVDLGWRGRQAERGAKERSRAIRGDSVGGARADGLREGLPARGGSEAPLDLALAVVIVDQHLVELGVAYLQSHQKVVVLVRLLLHALVALCKFTVLGHELPCRVHHRDVG